MSTLNELGFAPIKKTNAHRGGKPSLCFSVNVGSNSDNANYALNLNKLVQDQHLNWTGVDIAPARELAGVLITNGNTFGMNKDKVRVSSIELYYFFWKFFGLKKVTRKAKISFSYEKFSDANGGVFLLKMNSVDFFD